ncbi:MAG: gamma-glutamyltransferase [Proteobacteria bacterium]|nr:gamma-glutamyltransferase [Pseudomonadota bacterium]
MTAKGTKGIVAAGHPETTRAAAIILEEGGNAFDAVLAAIYAASVVEPVLCSLGGGGFLLAHPGDGKPVLYDFFTQTPKQKATEEDLDFFPIDADFGAVTQEFHIGMASMATPGTVRGLFQVHRDHCTMPMRRIVEPAMALARNGFTVNRLQAYLFQVVGPIYMSSAASRDIFAGSADPDGLKIEGETMTNPDFADTLDVLAREGEDLFYRGEIAASIAADCRHGGGLLSTADFEGYQAHQRQPLGVDYRGARILTNPPPSSGGILIAFALEMLKDMDIRGLRFGTPEYFGCLAKVMEVTNKARIDSGLLDATESLLDPAFLATYKSEITGQPQVNRGTTHVSIIDAAGNAAALTLSNGEGAGYIAPGTGIMLNNMLGEEDINPAGFHRWPENTRMCSMMAPSLAVEPGGGLIAFGSGGSNRIRTAILQVVVNLLDFGMSVEDAVNAPRVHFEGGLLNIEHGIDDDVITRLVADFAETKCWDERNLFFGGVHVARRKASSTIGNAFHGAGDPRRGGAVEIV